MTAAVLLERELRSSGSCSRVPGGRSSRRRRRQGRGQDRRPPSLAECATSSSSAARWRGDQATDRRAGGAALRRGRGGASRPTPSRRWSRRTPSEGWLGLTLGPAAPRLTRNSRAAKAVSGTDKWASSSGRGSPGNPGDRRAVADADAHTVVGGGDWSGDRGGRPRRRIDWSRPAAARPRAARRQGASGRGRDPGCMDQAVLIAGNWKMHKARRSCALLPGAA